MQVVGDRSRSQPAPRNAVLWRGGSEGLHLHPLLWLDGEMLDLGTLGGAQSYAFGINRLGQIVGTSGFSADPLLNHAFVWERGQMVDLNNAVTNLPATWCTPSRRQARFVVKPAPLGHRLVDLALQRGGSPRVPMTATRSSHRLDVASATVTTGRSSPMRSM
ncbi:MAG: hypothetical protein ACR2KO_08355 [Geodermatophilaceae bacterium]